MADLDRLSVHLATLRPERGLEEAVPALAGMGIHRFAPLAEQLRRLGIREAVRLVRDYGMLVSSCSRGGFFTAASERERRERIDDNRRLIEEAARLGAPCVVMVAGGLPPGSKDLLGARHMVEDALAALIDDAAGAGVKLALEPLHPMYAAEGSVVTTLEQALEICDGLGADAPVGVMVDVYHCWWDPKLPDLIARAGSGRLLGLQVSDWLVPTRGQASARGMPGEGVIDIAAIRTLMDRHGYHGPIEVEVWSADHWWRREPREVLVQCLERFALFC